MLPTKSTFKLASIAATLVLLSACSDSKNKMHEGTFIDSAVAGLNYTCGEQTGVTNIEGKFNYKSGDTCSFKLGDFLLGSITGMSRDKSIISPLDIAENDKYDTAFKIASLLQTIDADGNPDNGIDISNFDAAGLTNEIFTSHTSGFYKEVFELTGLEPVKLGAAAKHMHASLGLAKGYHSAAIDKVVTEIDNVNDFDQLDMDSFIANIHTILDSGDDSDSNDINTLRSVLSIYEILNDSRVQARLEFLNSGSNNSDSNLKSQPRSIAVLPKMIKASLKASTPYNGITGSTEDVSGLFFDMSSRLVAASDALSASFSDPTYVANYGDSFFLSAPMVYNVQVAALSAATVLSYVSAYNYASDEYYFPQSIEQELQVIEQFYFRGAELETSINVTSITAESDFTKAGLHPESLYLDDNLARLHNDQKYLSLAKKSLIKTIEVMKNSALNNGDTDEEEQAEIASLDNYLNNLIAKDGNLTPLILGGKDKEMSAKINLQALFSLDTAIDRDDFIISASKSCGDLTYSELFSKYLNSPMCSSGTYNDGVILTDENSAAVSFTYDGSTMSKLSVYAAPADVNISVEPTSTLYDRFVVECNTADNNGNKGACLDF